MSQAHIDEHAVVIEACNYNRLGGSSIVINPAELGRCVWIHLNPDICPLQFFKAEEISTKTLLHEGAAERVSPTWLKIFTQELNLEVGYHAYRLQFHDCKMPHSIFQYIAYQIQTPDVPKPYLYIDRQETTS